jgi:hypothetical protein
MERLTIKSFDSFSYLRILRTCSYKLEWIRLNNSKKEFTAEYYGLRVA